ncbi:HTH-type transcriptional regulator DmlR [Ensifer sp. M14]|nr:HTH-type transcriptional regulator DmlR [Ensifer sp. M14]
MSYLNGVSVFVEAADAGGFSAAAERLNLSRSAVGKTVAKLEQSLGVRLFHRTTRTQSLTDEGQLFYENCLRGLGEIRAGEALLESGKQEIQGRLRLSMPVHFGRQCIMPLLSSCSVNTRAWSSTSISAIATSISSRTASISPSAPARSGVNPN